MMDSGCLVLDSSPSHQYQSRGGRMIFLGGRNPVFQDVEVARSVLSMTEGTNKRRRSFFTSPEELLEEEYYDEQLPEKKRRLKMEQVEILERSFKMENKLEPERKSELARNLGLQPRQVAVWFQNRRARWKTKQLECDFDRLKASYDALAADRDVLLKDYEDLQSQVISLTEKLQDKELAAEAGATSLKQINPSEAEAICVAENQLSTGSAVVDGEGTQLVDSSGESYFQESYQGGCAVGIQSEEDGGGDDGCSYLPGDVLAVNNNTELGWWVWN